MRLEKGYPRYGSELNTEVTPFEAGVGFAVDMSKGGFTGFKALQRVQQSGQLRYQIVTLVLDDGTIDAIAGETIYYKEEIIGYVTSGAFGHTVNWPLAMALIKPEYAQDGQCFEVDILGDRRAAILRTSPPVDPGGLRLRS